MDNSSVKKLPKQIKTHLKTSPILRKETEFHWQYITSHATERRSTGFFSGRNDFSDLLIVKAIVGCDIFRRMRAKSRGATYNAQGFF